MQITQILQAVQRARLAGDDTYSGDGWRVQRIRVGMNNALYRVERGDQSWAVKLCVQDERRRAQREHAALQLLQAAGADIAPQPLELDESGTIVPYPAVVYGWLDGEPLQGSLSPAQLASLLEALQRLHAIAPQADDPLGTAGLPAARLPEAWFHWFDRRLYLEELDWFLAHYRNWLCEEMVGGVAIHARLERLVAACNWALKASPARIDRESVPLRLCHVDPNPANILWGNDGRVRWVDWEYCGWGDPALDLAEYRWHQAFSFMSAEQTAWLRARYQPPPGDAGFAQRLALWDALLAARWPFLLLRWLWSIHNGPDRERLNMPQAQADQVRLEMLELIRRAEEFYRLKY